MRDVLSAVIGKSVRQVARLRGGGSALPGLVVEKLDPGCLQRTLARLPYGVVAVSGTNGKTTTVKMIVEILEAQGLKVFTNRTGSNFSRGIVAAAIQECSLGGRIDADIAVLELDEAHAMYFIDRVRPRFTLLLNVLRDQLDLGDRGHIEGRHAVFNEGLDDPRRRIGLHRVEDVAFEIFLEPARRYRHRVRSRNGDRAFRWPLTDQVQGRMVRAQFT